MSTFRDTFGILILKRSDLIEPTILVFPNLVGMLTFEVYECGNYQRMSQVGVLDLKQHCTLMPSAITKVGPIAAWLPDPAELARTVPKICIKSPPACECGAESVGSSVHPSYCPKGASP